MKTRVHSVLGLVVLCVGLTSAISCSRSSPVSPSAPPPPALQGAEHALSASPVTLANGLQAISADAAVFPLLAGSFAIVNRDGDGIVGTYSGTTQFAEGAQQKSSLTFQISNGSGTFAGATGILEVKGVGSFAGAGEFLLDGGGEVTLAAGKRAVVMLSLRGSSVASCSGGHIAIDQTAEGALARAGRVAARLSHVVGNTGCAS
jgi:hypothetical protein